MKIVLLGASGFVGRHLVPRLAREGHHCVVLTKNAGHCRQLQQVPGVQVVVADVHDQKSLQAHLGDADMAVNLVGILNEKGRGGSGFEAVHVTLVEKLIAACKASGVERVLHVSALNAGEGSSHYLRTKGLGEERLRSAQGIRTTIFQPSVIFGPDDAFINRFAGMLRLFPCLPLACANSRLQPVSIEDVCDAIAMAAERPETAGNTYPLVGSEQWTLGELVRWIGEQMGVRRWVPGLPDPVSRLQAALMGLVPGKPFSMDNYRSLQTPNTCDQNGLDAFGIHPASLRAVVPSWLTGSLRQRRNAERRKLAGRL